MNKISYINRWKTINTNFDEWFDGESWSRQQKYLSSAMKKEFVILDKDVKKIFSMFNTIYTDKAHMFDWDEYQFPTLVAITANYIKKLK